ncbi:MAG TPA: hypothetical protein VF735_19530 [Pyrinomonadaceae bacterium]|jgi:hypothetical protein
MRKTAPVIVAALLVLCCYGSVSVRAQAGDQSATPQAAPPANQQSASQSDSLDLSITANVTARELRFEAVPDPKVEFPGKPERTTVWEAERQNLPRPVEPGVTYRNIGIQLKITSVFADIDRIVAEALGEVPASDTTTPATQPPTPQPESTPQSMPQPEAAPPSSVPAQQESEGNPL